MKGTERNGGKKGLSFSNSLFKSLQWSELKIAAINSIQVTRKGGRSKSTETAAAAIKICIWKKLEGETKSRNKVTLLFWLGQTIQPRKIHHELTQRA